MANCSELEARLGHAHQEMESTAGNLGATTSELASKAAVCERLERQVAELDASLGYARGRIEEMTTLHAASADDYERKLADQAAQHGARESELQGCAENLALELGRAGSD